MMTTIRVLAAVCCVGMGIVFAGDAHADAVSDARSELLIWQPNAVYQTESALVIVVPREQVTNRFYTTMMRGFCADVTASGRLLEGVTEIVVLSSTRFSGWVFEGGVRECRQLDYVASSEIPLQISGMSHLHLCKMPGSCKY